MHKSYILDKTIIIIFSVITIVNVQDWCIDHEY